jgi:N-acetylmuramoyl-L-alanine amidase
MLDIAAVMCMSLTLYHEARGEPFPGQVAVGYVLYRRADFDTKNICKETYRPYQFEWTSKAFKVPTMQQLQPYIDLSNKILNQQVKDYSHGATHFHSVELPNQWGMKPRTVIKNHVFY